MDINEDALMNTYNIPAKAWIRFWARTVDIWLLSTILIFLSYLLVQELEYSYIWVIQWVLTPFFIMVVDVIYEGICLSRFGTTLGKYIFSIQVVHVEGTYLNFTQSLIRTAKVWLLGYALNFPVASIVTRIVQFTEYESSGFTSWDKEQSYHVIIKKKKTKSVGSIILFLMVIILHMSVLIYTNGSLMSQSFSTSTSAMERRVESMMTDQDYQGIIDYLEQYMDNDHITDTLANQLGYAYMTIGAYDQAKSSFLMGVEIVQSDEVLEALYNNLSWAYYNLEAYEEALLYSEKGLELDQQDATLFVNYGNALLALDRNEEAIGAYEDSIQVDEEIKEAFYGLGTIAYNEEAYETAIDHFEKYIAIEEDVEVYCYLALAHLYSDETTNTAEMYLDKAEAIDPESSDVINTLESYYFYIGAYDLAIELYEKEKEKNPDNYELLCDLSEAYGYNDQEDMAFATIEHAISIQPTDTYAYTIKADLYYWLDDQESAERTIEEMLGNSKDQSSANGGAGEFYYNMANYLKAFHYYELAIEIDVENQFCYERAVASLYYAKRYTRCLEIADFALSKFENSTIEWYAAFVYSDLNEQNLAISHYMNALVLLPEDIDLQVNIGWEHYYKQDYSAARAWVQKALLQDNSYESAKELSKAIDAKEQPLLTQISNFVEDNYLYFKSNDAYQLLKKDLIQKENQSLEDIYDLFGTVYNPEDAFTFILSGDDYAQYEAIVNEETVDHKTLGEGQEYIRINSFLPTTSNEFLDIIEGIENTQDKTLIIDLRDNYGGDVLSGCNILDFLLENCVVCNLIDKDGYSSEYYSDAAQIEFKEIFVLTNENSASCSELVTLGLKTYLDNVTVIGETTYGKGVGQIVLEDQAREFVFFLVNFYWNVREINIMDVGIEPDIRVDSDNVEDYLNRINQL